ncbi:hypothetical protein PHIN6_11540 [Polynucleobacter sp. HIN6]|uniref:phasin family protein n=1 Tax=Polynucleobacter sp. HIN6 TaxID=3047865 RepID=UPI002572C76A|nr:phasin family protein [Polynucleobacter sp. HIN6]BEI35636.1 hypothetical protein PHIN6_11540 [Polynucleobacter sp. HIN6]
MKKPSAAAKKAKAQELFTLSHKLLDAAKQLSEHHAAELRYNMQQAMEAAKTAAQKDVTKLQALQKKAAEDATKRMSVYQKKVKAILKDIGNEAADGAEKHFDRARDAISDWIKEADKKIPMGGEKLAKVVREVSDAGAKVFKEGRKAVEGAINSAEKNLHTVAKKASKVIAPKAPTKRKTAVKKLVPRKTSRAVKKTQSSPSENSSY